MFLFAAQKAKYGPQIFRSMSGLSYLIFLRYFLIFYGSQIAASRGGKKVC